MLHRRSVLGAASAAVTSPVLLLAGCGGGDDGDDGPTPIPASASVIRFPIDQYLHLGTPTEWWWHTGTLRAGSRVFGFEINAASFRKDGVGFTQVSLTDVAGNRHYQATVPYLPPLQYDPDRWAQPDTTKDWSVQLGNPANALSGIQVTSAGSGYTSAPKVEVTGGGGILALAEAVLDGKGGVGTIVVVSAGIGFTSPPTVTLTGGGGSGATARAIHSYVTMQAPASDPTRNMAIKALTVDEGTGTSIGFDLAMSQNGPPLIVWGTGVKEVPGTTPALLRNNYYYSLTHLQTTGSVSIGGETTAVTGVTWMDHEYGAFGSAENPVKWILQAMQLDNGARVHSYTVLEPVLNQRSRGEATVMLADGSIYLVESFVTPFGRTWTSPRSGRTFFMQLKVEIPDFDATIVVESLVDSQEFPVAGGPVYEGVASANGTFRGSAVSGTAWNEQALG